MLDCLVAAGGNINARNTETGRTPLMSAFDGKVTEALLRYGADPTLKDNDGKTAWDHAADKKNGEVTEILRRALDALQVNHEDPIIIQFPSNAHILGALPPLPNNSDDSNRQESSTREKSTRRDHVQIKSYGPADGFQTAQNGFVILGIDAVLFFWLITFISAPGTSISPLTVVIAGAPLLLIAAVGWLVFSSGRRRLKCAPKAIDTTGITLHNDQRLQWCKLVNVEVHGNTFKIKFKEGSVVVNPVAVRKGNSGSSPFPKPDLDTPERLHVTNLLTRILKPIADREYFWCNCKHCEREVLMPRYRLRELQGDEEYVVDQFHRTSDDESFLAIDCPRCHRFNAVLAAPEQKSMNAASQKSTTVSFDCQTCNGPVNIPQEQIRELDGKEKALAVKEGLDLKSLVAVVCPECRTTALTNKRNLGISDLGSNN